MRIGSLFSGIGGLELGLEMAGVGQTIWQVEQSRWCRSILARHWAAAERHNDVCAVGSATLAPVDVICGGFPCQDISAANPFGRGIDGTRSGLWFEFERIIGEMRPCGVVIENSPRLVRKGLDRVVAGLDRLGFQVAATRIQAADVGAPHKRERIVIVAVAHAHRAREPQPQGSLEDVGRRPCDFGSVGHTAGVRRPQPGGVVDQGGGPMPFRSDQDVGHPDRQGLAVREGERGHARTQQPPPVGAGGIVAQSGMVRGAYGIPHWLGQRWPAGRGEAQHLWEPVRAVAPDPDRSKRWERGRRVSGLGNAVVPWVGFVAGRMLLQMLEES